MSQSMLDPNLLIELGHYGGGHITLWDDPGLVTFQAELAGEPISVPVGGIKPMLSRNMYESIAHLLPPKPKVAFFGSAGRPIPDCLKSEAVYVVSDAFKTLVEPYARDAEFIPVELWECPDDGTSRIWNIREEPFWWFNCWRRLDLIDWDRTDALFRPPPDPQRPSRFDSAPIRIGGWKRLVLRQEPAPDEHIYGLSGLSGGRLFLSPWLHGQILNAGLRVRFLPTQLAHRNELISKYLRMLDPNWAKGARI